MPTRKMSDSRSVMENGENEAIYLTTPKIKAVLICTSTERSISKYTNERAYNEFM